MKPERFLIFMRVWILLGFLFLALCWFGSR